MSKKCLTLRAVPFLGRIPLQSARARRVTGCTAQHRWCGSAWRGKQQGSPASGPTEANSFITLSHVIRQCRGALPNNQRKLIHAAKQEDFELKQLSAGGHPGGRPGGRAGNRPVDRTHRSTFIWILVACGWGRVGEQYWFSRWSSRRTYKRSALACRLRFYWNFQDFKIAVSNKTKVQNLLTRFIFKTSKLTSKKEVKT